MVERTRVAAVVPLILLIVAVGCSTGESDGDSTAGNPTAERDAPDPAALQIRPVEAITTPGLDEYQHEPTCGAGADSPCTGEQLLDTEGIALEDAEGNRYVLGPLVADGSDVSSATTVDLGDGTWGVQIALDPEGTTSFASAAANAVPMTPPANQIAIVVDGSVVSAPVVQERIESGQVQISGGFSQQEAEDLAAALRGS